MLFLFCFDLVDDVCFFFYHFRILKKKTKKTIVVYLVYTEYIQVLKTTFFFHKCHKKIRVIFRACCRLLVVCSS